MKHIMVKYLLFLMLFFGIPGIAMSHGGGHSHEPISSDAAKLKAKNKVSELAQGGKIDASWENSMPINIEQRAPDHDMEWVISFKNSKFQDTIKQTLYLFYSLDGDFITSSYVTTQ